MKALYFDCYCGASGDMILGALIDAGVEFDSIRGALEGLKVSGYSLSAEKVDKHGTMATQFSVELDETLEQPHRHLRHIVEIIEESDLPPGVKEASLKTFHTLAVCEAEVHGTTPEKIHFHEVGAVDSIVDVVGAHLALAEIAPDVIFSSPLHVGSGTVKCAHGVMPVPAPATALLIRGVPSYGGDVDGELLTPTGAALIAQVATDFCPMPAMKIDAVGTGSGTKDLPDRPNTLRVFIGEMSGTTATEQVVVMEANIDDMNPELYPNLLEDVLGAGALDVFVTPILGKKGRPAHLITVLIDEKNVDAVAAKVFAASTTLGVRMRREDRICLERHWQKVATPWGPVRIKIGRYQGRTSSTSPEYEDCVRVAKDGGASVLEVYEAAYAAAIKGELEDV